MSLSLTIYVAGPLSLEEDNTPFQAQIGFSFFPHLHCSQNHLTSCTVSGMMDGNVPLLSSDSVEQFFITSFLSNFLNAFSSTHVKHSYIFRDRSAMHLLLF